MSAKGIAPIATCIQKPIQPNREKALATLSPLDGLKILRSVCNIRFVPYEPHVLPRATE